MNFDYPQAYVPSAAFDKPKRGRLHEDTICSIRPTSACLLDAPRYLVDWAGRQRYKESYEEAKYFSKRVTEIHREEGRQRAEEFFYTA